MQPLLSCLLQEEHQPLGVSVGEGARIREGEEGEWRESEGEGRERGGRVGGKGEGGWRGEGVGREQGGKRVEMKERRIVARKCEGPGKDGYTESTWLPYASMYRQGLYLNL